VLRSLRRLIEGVTLPIKGGLLLIRHRRLLALALAPLLLNILLYAAAVFLFVRYYDEWFGLLMDRPEVWYWLTVYYLLRVLALLVGVAVFIFSFVFVGTVIAAPFLELLSEQTEAILRGGDDQPFRFRQWLIDVTRSVGHAVTVLLILVAALPLSFVPVVGHLAWLGLGWVLLAYEFAGFAMDRRRLSFREKWRSTLSDLSGSVGFGAAAFFLMAIPLLGLISLPVAAVAGTMLFLTREDVPAPQ
jgi:CysZ protein